jgi:8-oxo-dGTP pyrophosphatase MutT (NUDIX family)
MNFPVSIKGVLVEAGSVMLLENERDEWELPGGRLEPGEAPETCLVREFAEELGAVVDVASIIDCWLYEVLPECAFILRIKQISRYASELIMIFSGVPRFTANPTNVCIHRTCSDSAVARSRVSQQSVHNRH